MSDQSIKLMELTEQDIIDQALADLASAANIISRQLELLRAQMSVTEFNQERYKIAAEIKTILKGAV